MKNPSDCGYNNPNIEVCS